MSKQILNAFAFFPVFLLFGFLTYVASLWRRFVEMGTFVQGKIHKTAILAGGAVVDPACEKTKARMWKLYRYLNVAHLLCYYDIAPHLHESLDEPCCDQMADERDAAVSLSARFATILARKGPLLLQL